MASWGPRLSGQGAWALQVLLPWSGVSDRLAGTSLVLAYWGATPTLQVRAATGTEGGKGEEALMEYREPV